MSDEIGPQGLLDHVASELARELRQQRRARAASIPAPDGTEPKVQLLRSNDLFRIYVNKTGEKLVGVWRIDPVKDSYERIDKGFPPGQTPFIPACAMAHHGFVATLVKCPLYRLHEPHGTPIPGLWYKAQGVFKRADEEDDGHRRFITKDEARGRGLTAAQIYVPSPPAVGVGALNMAVYDPPASYGLLAAPGADDPIVPPPAPPPEEQAADEAGKPASVVEEFDTIARRMREIREAEGRQAPA